MEISINQELAEALKKAFHSAAKKGTAEQFLLKNV